MPLWEGFEFFKSRALCFLFHFFHGDIHVNFFVSFSKLIVESNYAFQSIVVDCKYIMDHFVFFYFSSFSYNFPHRFLTTFTSSNNTQGVKQRPYFLDKLIWAQVNRLEDSISLQDITRNGSIIVKVVKFWKIPWFTASVAL